MKKKEKITIGWKERISFPDWHINGMVAKIDTGARTSSLDVEDIKELPAGFLSFYVVIDKKNEHKRKRVLAKIVKKGRVKSSSGHPTTRWYVKTKIKIGEVVRPIDINLVDRKTMLHRMLLGRKALEHLLIDVDKTFLLRKKKI